ncbi:MAG TPA: cation-efflux pump [Terriglobia bacterium]|nr:cation-efflux pump [Terriglobia bacterium]
MLPSLQAPPADRVPAREKQSVALASVGTATLLVILKVVIGVTTGSLGILSEAAHSALDLVAAAVTYFSVRVSDKPADREHPFGHGKVESLAAFVETGLLLAACAAIVFEAVRRLFFHAVHVQPSAWAFAVMVISAILDSIRSRALFRVARKYQSQALEADALHFSMDVWSSLAVILGLAFVLIARQGNLPLLERADPVAALMVAGITLYISVQLGRRTWDTLLDAAPEGTSARIAASVSEVPGVVMSERIRVRQSGQQLFVDLRLTLPGDIPFEHAQTMVESVESKVREIFPTADVVIHATPQAPAAQDTVARVRAVANRHNFKVHDVTAYEVKGRVRVSLDLEVDPSLTLQAAHDRATELESAVRSEIEEIGEVNVHIEPLVDRVEPAAEAPLAASSLETRLMRIARDTPGLVDCHSLEAHEVGSNVYVAMHCTVEPDLSVARVHDITEELEFRFRQAFPQIFKVNIHAEPRGAEREREPQRDHEPKGDREAGREPESGAHRRVSGKPV